MGDSVTTRPLRPDDLTALASLFATERTTRHCSCMAFCSSGRQFALGWFGGGNARRFAALTAASPNPMGVLAFRGDDAVGWAACGPRSRYSTGTARTRLISELPPAQTTWFAPCFFVRRADRGQGITHALLRAVVDLASGEGAGVIEGWPVAASVARSPDAFVGREQVFADLGFAVVDRPTPGRVIMRLDRTG